MDLNKTPAENVPEDYNSPVYNAPPAYVPPVVNPPQGYQVPPGYNAPPVAPQAYQQPYGGQNYQPYPGHTPPQQQYMNAFPNTGSTEKTTMALIFGIIGIFFIPILFGILGFTTLNKAASLGEAPSTTGTVAKVLAYINVIQGVFWIILSLFFFLISMAAGS